MIFLVVIFYFLVSSYDILYLYNNNLKREIPIYVFIMSISIVISSLIALKISIPSPMIYFGKILEPLRKLLGGIV